MPTNRLVLNTDASISSDYIYNITMPEGYNVVYEPQPSKKALVRKYAKELKDLIGETYKYTHKKKESAILEKLFEALNEEK